MLVGFLIVESLIEIFILRRNLSFFEQIIPSSVLYGVFLIFTYFYTRYTNTTWYEIGFHRDYAPKSLLMGFLATSGYLVVIGVYIGYLMAVGVSQLPLNISCTILNLPVSCPIIIIILIIILLLFTLVIGFTEETLFRGYIQANFQKEMSQMKAVLLTGILFAFLHIPSYVISGSFENLLGLSSLILIGLILGFIRIRTGNIWGVSIAHATWDFYQFLFTPSNIQTTDITLIVVLIANGGMWGTIVLTMILAKRWIDRPTQIPGELINEYSWKIENLTKQIWKLYGIISVLQLRGFRFGRKIEHYSNIVRTSEEVIEVLKVTIPNINELTYKRILKLVPLKLKWIKLKNSLNLVGYPTKMVSLQSKLASIEAKIAAIERKFGSAKSTSNLENQEQLK